MMQIISETPTYAWLLLVFLLWGGWKSRKDYIISWKSLLIMPAAMLFWSIYSIIDRHSSVAIFLWVLSLAVGIWLGSLTVLKSRLRIDKELKLIEVSGSWIPLVLSVTIFSLRYFLGMMYGFYPLLVDSYSMLAVECVATLVSGMFTGRLVGYYQKSKTASHIKDC